jgi:hypothetical protein
MFYNIYLEFHTSVYPKIIKCLSILDLNKFLEAYETKREKVFISGENTNISNPTKIKIFNTDKINSTSHEFVRTKINDYFLTISMIGVDEDNLYVFGSDVTNDFIFGAWGEKKPELYNLYLKTLGTKEDKIQIKYALDVDNINEILIAIKNGNNSVFVDGRNINLIGIETIKIFDVSKTENKFDKGNLKNEIKQRSNVFGTSGLNLLTNCGLEVTHKFKISIISKKDTDVIHKVEKAKTELPFEGKIFISHAVADAKLVQAFTEHILELGLGLNAKNDIFNISIEGAGIISGEKFKDRIENELKNAKAVIQIITENYKKSEACLNEMGAAWILNTKVIPFLKEPISYNSVGFIHNTTQLLKIDSKVDIKKFVADYKGDLFQLNYNDSKLDRKIDEFLDLISNIIPVKIENVVEKTDTLIISSEPIIIKVKNRKGSYLQKGKIYHAIPDDITMNLLGYYNVKIIEISVQEFEKLTKGQALQSVYSAELIQERITKHYWILLNNKRHGVPDVATINYLVNNCACKVPGILSVNDFEKIPQEDDLISITKFISKPVKGWK